MPQTPSTTKPSSFVDTRVIYCGDALEHSQDALDEIGRFFKQTHKAIVALTVKEILDEQIAMKLV